MREYVCTEVGRIMGRTVVSQFVIDEIIQTRLFIGTSAYHSRFECCGFVVVFIIRSCYCLGKSNLANALDNGHPVDNMSKSVVNAKGAYVPPHMRGM
jgi:hypothetical protein